MINLTYPTPSEGDTHIEGTVLNTEWGYIPEVAVTFKQKIVYTNGVIDISATEALVREAQVLIDQHIEDGILQPH